MHWNKGKKQTEEHKRKRGLALSGRKLSEEHKMKISKSKIGVRSTLGKHWKMSEEGKKNISLASPKFWLGKHHSNETRQKISKNRIGKYTGQNSPYWKGGISNINQLIRNSTEIILWRKACFERDNFTCQKTGQIGGKLVVHHINNFADFPELRTSIENGITLSEKSHREFHKRYGRQNNTRKQLEEFLLEPVKQESTR